MLQPHQDVLTAQQSRPPTARRATWTRTAAPDWPRPAAAHRHLQRRAAVAQACRVAIPAPTTASATRGALWRRAERRLRYVMERHGITRAGLKVVPHGLRHQDAADAYRSMTGKAPPVASGGAVDAALDAQVARQAIAEHLGHGHEAIVNAYLGRPTPAPRRLHPQPTNPDTRNPRTPKEMNDVRDRRNPGTQPLLAEPPHRRTHARRDPARHAQRRNLFHICDEHAEGCFVPTAAFMRRPPTWRLDVLGDILLGIQRAQQHAAVELFRELSRKNPEVGLERQLRELPESVPAAGPRAAGKRGGVDRAGSALHLQAHLTRQRRQSRPCRCRRFTCYAGSQSGIDEATARDGPPDQYYRTVRGRFFGSTVAVDMAPIHQRFLALLTHPAPTSSFSAAPARVAMPRPSSMMPDFRSPHSTHPPELARLAQRTLRVRGRGAALRDVDEVRNVRRHLVLRQSAARAAGRRTGHLDRLWRTAPGGTCTVSSSMAPASAFMAGAGSPDTDEATLRQWFGRWPDVHQIDVWLTDDQRPDRTERWTNALAARKPVPNQRLVTDGADHFLPPPLPKRSPGPRRPTWRSRSSRPRACGSCCPTCSRWSRPVRRSRCACSPATTSTSPTPKPCACCCCCRSAAPSARLHHAGRQLPPQGLHLRQGWTGGCSRQEPRSSAPATSAGGRCRTGWGGTTGRLPGDSGFLEARHRFDERVVRSPEDRGAVRCLDPRPTNSGGFRPRDRSRPAATSRRHRPSDEDPA